MERDIKFTCVREYAYVIAWKNDPCSYCDIEGCYLLGGAGICKDCILKIAEAVKADKREKTADK